MSPIRRSQSIPWLLALAFAGALSLTATATANVTEPAEATTLEQLWQSYVGQTGVLERGSDGCHYTFVPSTPSQVGNARVSRVARDHVVIEERRDNRRTLLTIPLGRMILREQR